MIEISPDSLKMLLDQEKDLLLVDVREPWEFEHCHINGSQNIPLSVLLEEGLPPVKEDTVVTICHHGVRSLNAAIFLRKIGFSALSLKGGVNAWSLEIDPRLPRY